MVRIINLMESKRPRLLDLFCGAGGAAMGYYRAGFEVVGVDIKPQPHYPFEFHQANALTYPLEGFDAYHASPPCQGYTFMNNRYPERRNSHPKLIIPIRGRFVATGKPFIIENVIGAKKEMLHPFKLHGGMFGLRVHRPRLFESNLFLLMPQSEKSNDIVGVYGRAPDGRRLWGSSTQARLRAASSIKEASEAMGINWMVWTEIKEAIPPAYTEYIGKYLIKIVPNFAHNYYGK